MQSKFLISLAVAVFVSTLVFAFGAGAQETGDDPLVFAEGEKSDQAQVNAQQPGPLSGTRVETLSTDSDLEVEIITIPRTNCTFEEGASFILEDEDGTQADFIDDVNVQISEVDGMLEVVSSDTTQDANIVPLNERGGDDVLDTGGLVIVTSTDIECEASTPPPNSPPPNTPPPNSPPPSSASPTPEPQDKDKGPLAGGTAIGKDVLVPGDIIDILPDGTRVVGIDQIVIQTKDCELTAKGDDLTITMSDRGVPFRVRDGDNVDITLQADGTLVSNGRRTLGDSFPGTKDNPDRLIIPIPVDPENDQFAEGPNNTFPIISSTGVGGDGCRVVDNAADANNANDNGSIDSGNNANPEDDVIDDTIVDEPLPDTGGAPLLVIAAWALFLGGGGFLFVRSMTRRNR